MAQFNSVSKRILSKLENKILWKYYGNKVRYGNKILCECYVCRKVKLKVQFKYLKDLQYIMISIIINCP